MNNKLRWDPYYIVKNDGFIEFWKDHNSTKNRKYLFIMGEGFDPRMNFVLSKIYNIIGPSLNELILINFDEGDDSPSKKNESYIKNNIIDLNKIIKNNTIIINKKILLWKIIGTNRRRIGSFNAYNLFSQYKEIKDFTDIIFDISSLPRSIYFPIVHQLINIIDSNQMKINLFITVAENFRMDQIIEEIELDENASFIYGFEGRLEYESQSGKPIIWIPILGEKKLSHLEKVYSFLPKTDEICPLLPFPSKNPRRADNLFLEYYYFLYDTLLIENHNIIYASEQNPFDVYRKINNTFVHYNKSLKILNGCNGIVSTFSSKLLSIGALLISHEYSNYKNNLSIGILNVEPRGYIINNNMIDNFLELIDKSECFTLWITGEPYEEK